MRIEDIDKKINELNKFKSLLSIGIKDEDTLNTKIFKKYLEEENVKKVAEYINSLGYRKAGCKKPRKFISNDISEILSDKNIILENEELKEIVAKLFKSNKKGMVKNRY